MRAAIARRGGIVVDDLPAPEPGPGEVLVRTRACGICGSDLHALQHGHRVADLMRRSGGLFSADPDPDLVPGHEFCAEVVDDGPGTERTISVGSLVRSEPVVLGPGGIEPVGFSNHAPGGDGQHMRLMEGLPVPVPNGLAVGSERRVCLITGDSAFQFHISELETAVRKNLPIVCIVNSDAAWGMELGVFAGAFGLDRDIEVKWGDVRLDKIAEGDGAHVEFVDRTEDVGPAVERALASGRPAVVQVAVDQTVNAFHAPHVEEFATWYTGGYSA